MKKYIVYIAILIVGLFLGWLLFGGASNSKTTHDHEASATKQMWTCSMHPQIMQPEPGDCPICGMDLIPAEAGAEGVSAEQFKLTKNAMALANIQTTEVGAGHVGQNGIKLSGKIVANEQANTVQASYFSGRIERLHVNFTGEDIRKGQLLATIYSPELYAAQQELLTAAGLKESQPALYQAVRNKLKLWKLSENQINQIEETGNVKEHVPVYATVSGTVTEKLVAQGDYIKQGQPLLKIANLNTVWANFDVYENQINAFKTGQDISVSTAAYPNKVFKGKVDFIDPILNTQTRTVVLRVVLNNQDQIFKPGMFVSARLEGVANKDQEVITVPTSAVLWTGERSVVYVKSSLDQPVFEMREVVLGHQIGDGYQILKGLNVGDQVVTNGTFTVDAAAQLQGKKSMMNHTKQIAVNFEVPQEFKTQLQQVYNSYISLKDALVKTDMALATASAKSLKKDLGRMDMKLLTNEAAHEQWMALYKPINTNNNAIAQAANIETQRKHFKTLSDHFITAVQSFGINETAYKQYCPMANSDKGAYWLSKEKEVLNPYFGDQMLKCGEVKQVIE
ncbi:MAG: efflux RND transporter periplasmic adaptor subunit [Algicola sp.]|nr:efflux RND transporter periplasmic adaptor subunit [Algicola sp.]